MRVVVFPSAPDAATVICHLPLVSSNGVENDPSPPTGTVTWAGGRGVMLDLAGLPPVVEPLAPAYVALTTTWLAFFAVPETGIAPFWKLAPSAGESIVRSGAWTTEYGTLMMIWTCLSEFFSVSGSVAETKYALRVDPGGFLPRAISSSSLALAARIGPMSSSGTSTSSTQS